MATSCVRLLADGRKRRRVATPALSPVTIPTSSANCSTAITTGIGEASRVSDANALIVRTAETASALITALASVLAISPAAVRSLTAIRRTIDELGKRLRRRVVAAERDPEVQAFLRRCFNGTDSA